MDGGALDEGNAELSEFSLSLMWVSKHTSRPRMFELLFPIWRICFDFIFWFSNLVISFFFFPTREVGRLFKPVLLNILHMGGLNCVRRSDGVLVGHRRDGDWKRGSR